MKVVDAIAEILKKEGVDYLPCYPTTPIIEAAAGAKIRPIVCRQERVGVGIADGFSRVTNGRPPGVFAMQYGPGAENAFSGVATAYSDSVPMLLLPAGHPGVRIGVPPHFDSVRAYEPVTKTVERINTSERVSEIMRRAFSNLKMGRPGPVMVEIPSDIALDEADEAVSKYQPVRATCSAASPRDVDAAARALLAARSPVIYAGQGVMYAGACEELKQLAELVQAPVTTTLVGKSAFPEDHPLALGTGGATSAGPVVTFLKDADLVFGVGTSFTRHGMTITIPPGKVMVQATNDPRDINKDYTIDHPIIGDARLVLLQFIEAVKDRLGKGRPADGERAAQVKAARDAWLAEWMPKLTSDETPMTPYRVIWDLMKTVDPSEAIVTHDSGSPRDQMIPFYRAAGPRTYLGWGKSHGLGTGLGLAMGAKLADPDKLCINWMGDAAFGMVGLDFETAARAGVPILTIVSNNSTMAAETNQMRVSHDLYNTRDIGGNYADMARAMGGYSERVEKPSEIGPAIKRAKEATEEGRAALLEFITCSETAASHRRAFG
ncbi:MAG: thiamine pyrophosphate-requiring protein [Dehalococcoidia bacterium]|nr:thiamine pyrophosphate-requiring protein [Dehalococcoidia bacterium]